MNIRKYIFELTPLGKADKEVRQYLKENLDEEQFKRYHNALLHYRHIKAVQAALKILFYASIITSIATTIGLNGIIFIEQVSTYIGTSFVFLLYAATSYITMIRREAYHVQREILISKAS